jgi:tRNA(Ile)-lysidine synthase
LRLRLRTLIGSLRGQRLCLAYSGGADSSALLCALAALRGREGFRLRALHVNHQLYPHAAEWARTACALAQRLRVPCEVLEVRVPRPRGSSLEAQARRVRYRALSQNLGSDELLLTAHHQDDQVETLLLALLRGAGVRGLAAMSAMSRLEGVHLLRPLLPVARAQLEHYLRRRGITWSEDPSNQDQRFDRNYLRHAVLPALRARWPAVAATVSRSAAHLAEARELLDQLAQGSLRDARDGGALRVSVLRRLDPARRRNALRRWLVERTLPAPDQTRLRELAGPLLSARADALPCVRWPGAQVRRHGDCLLAEGLPVHDSVRPAQPPLEVARWDWHSRPWVGLGTGGSLGIVADRHGDLSLSALPAVLRVCYRRGGERLQDEIGHAPLKDLLQRHGVAPWLRSRVPLLVHRRQIVAVADLWLDPRYRARAGAAPRGRLQWRRA